MSQLVPILISNSSTLLSSPNSSLQANVLPKQRPSFRKKKEENNIRLNNKIFDMMKIANESERKGGGRRFIIFSNLA